MLQDEFADVTISKIRFLESQGLIGPERTPSGYRKFYDEDIDVLRWILRQQRESFLPLKVIKDRLEANDGRLPPNERVAPPPFIGLTATMPEAPTHSAPAAVGVDSALVPTAREALSGEPHQLRTNRNGDTPTSRFIGDAVSVSLTASELASSTGLPAERIAELERYGLISSRIIGPDRVYDGDALVVCQIAVAFAGYGVEPRHLRMFKVAAERESGMLAQLVAPFVRQRSAGRSAAIVRLEALAELGDGLRDVMLRQALRDLLL